MCAYQNTPRSRQLTHLRTCTSTLSSRQASCTLHASVHLETYTISLSGMSVFYRRRQHTYRHVNYFTFTHTYVFCYKRQLRTHSHSAKTVYLRRHHRHAVKCRSSLSAEDECTSNPCNNNGVCADLLNGYRCQCPDTSSGVRCERGEYLRCTCIELYL